MDRPQFRSANVMDPGAGFGQVLSSLQGQLGDYEKQKLAEESLAQRQAQFERRQALFDAAERREKAKFVAAGQNATLDPTKIVTPGETKKIQTKEQLHQFSPEDIRRAEALTAKSEEVDRINRLLKPNTNETKVLSRPDSRTVSLDPDKVYVKSAGRSIPGSSVPDEYLVDGSGRRLNPAEALWERTKHIGRDIPRYDTSKNVEDPSGQEGATYDVSNIQAPLKSGERENLLAKRDALMREIEGTSGSLAAKANENYVPAGTKTIKGKDKVEYKAPTKKNISDRLINQYKAETGVDKLSPELRAALGARADEIFTREQDRADAMNALLMRSGGAPKESTLDKELAKYKARELFGLPLDKNASKSSKTVYGAGPKTLNAYSSAGLGTVDSDDQKRIEKAAKAYKISDTDLASIIESYGQSDILPRVSGSMTDDVINYIKRNYPGK